MWTESFRVEEWPEEEVCLNHNGVHTAVSSKTTRTSNGGRQVVKALANAARLGQEASNTQELPPLRPRSLGWRLKGKFEVIGGFRFDQSISLLALGYAATCTSWYSDLGTVTFAPAMARDESDG
jgi:hypothetical protein